MVGNVMVVCWKNSLFDCSSFILTDSKKRSVSSSFDSERERERLPQKFTWIFDAVLSGLHISLFGSPAQDFHQEANNRVDV